jgi:hypothetical protein
LENDGRQCAQVFSPESSVAAAHRCLRQAERRSINCHFSRLLLKEPSCDQSDNKSQIAR